MLALVITSRSNRRNIGRTGAPWNESFRFWWVETRCGTRYPLIVSFRSKKNRKLVWQSVKFSLKQIRFKKMSKKVFFVCLWLPSAFLTGIFLDNQRKNDLQAWYSPQCLSECCNAIGHLRKRTYRNTQSLLKTLNKTSAVETRVGIHLPA